MSDEIKNINQNNAFASTQAAQAAEPAKNVSGTKGSSDLATVSQDEFLNLLVHQLQNQDPLNPMENEEFAVQLAQFSQLEQLVQINDKIDSTPQAEGSASTTSMAAYLGHEVAYSDNQVRVQGGSGSNLVVDVPAGTESVRVDLMDDTGAVVGNVLLEGFESSGIQALSLDGIELADGKYDARVLSVGSSGKFVELDSKSTATVEGFVMNPEPKLLVGGEEVSLEEISTVYRG